MTDHPHQCLCFLTCFKIQSLSALVLYLSCFVFEPFVFACLSFLSVFFSFLLCFLSALHTFLCGLVCYTFCRLFLWTNNHLHHGRIYHINTIFAFFVLFTYISFSMLFFCYSDASLAAVSVEIAIANALSMSRSFFVRSLFCVLGQCMPHTSLSVASESSSLKSQYCKRFCSSAM